MDVPPPCVPIEFTKPLDKKTTKRIHLIKKFNQVLRAYVDKKKFKYIDTYSFCSNEIGISNSIYHLDNVHLGPWSVKEIQELLIS